MNKYEIMFILKSNDEEAIKNQVSELKAIITDMKGVIESEKEMGNRKLAYPIKKELNGYYYVMNVNANNDVVQEFINQIVFLRICEDKNLPLYHNLKDTVADVTTLHNELEELFRSADRRYNSGVFSGDDIITLNTGLHAFCIRII